MSDEKKQTAIFFAQVEGQPPRLIRATDQRLARKFVLSSIYPPAVEVRRAETEEAIDLAIDGVAIEDATLAAAPLLDTADEPEQPDQPEAEDDLNDPVRVNLEDEVATDE